MGDVFGGLAGTPSHGRGPDLGPLEAALDGAALWGLELDPKFRVLAGTFEPTPERYAWRDAADRRIQVLCFPVSTILAAMRREEAGERQLLAFTEEQLVDVVAAFGGASVTAPLFDLREPRPRSWGPRFSLEGRSSAPDGTSRTLTLHLAQGDLELDLFARFDEVQVKDASGQEIALPDA